MGTYSNYIFGKDGVNIVKNPFEIGDGEATQLQNAEFVPDQGLGGLAALRTRGGFQALNASALNSGAAVSGIVGWPLKTTYNRILYAARGTQNSNTFKTSPDGTTWTDSAAATAAATDGYFTTQNTKRDARRGSSFKARIYYPGGGYTQGTDNPPLEAWDGTTADEVFRVPTYTGLGVPLAIVDTLVAEGTLYIAVHDPSGSSPNLNGRVFFLDLTTGILQLVATVFGGGTGQQNGGAPACLAYYQGSIYVGLNNGATTDGIGTIVRARPGIDTVWTVDASNLVSSVDSLAVFKGDLYAATQSSAANGAQIYKRDATTATWSSKYTSSGGASGNGHIAQFLVDNINTTLALYAAEYFDAGSGGAGDILRILRSTDGTTWSTDRDIKANDSPAAPPQFPGGSLIDVNGNVYYALKSTATATADGFLMKRTSGGSWSKVDTANYLGMLIQLVQRA